MFPFYKWQGIKIPELVSCIATEKVPLRYMPFSGVHIAFIMKTYIQVPFHGSCLVLRHTSIINTRMEKNYICHYHNSYWSIISF